MILFWVLHYFFLLPLWAHLLKFNTFRSVSTLAYVCSQCFWQIFPLNLTSHTCFTFWIILFLVDILFCSFTLVHFLFAVWEKEYCFCLWSQISCAKRKTQKLIFNFFVPQPLTHWSLYIHSFLEFFFKEYDHICFPL